MEETVPNSPPPGTTEPKPPSVDTGRLRDAFAGQGPDVPQAIGPYRIVGSLGSGGFGEVYKAERRHPMRQTVAIKVIKLGCDTREIIARFDSERQALARMDHPNVAKVLDAGTTDSGRPYFVMEYVPGEPITKFADDNKLSIKDRLELFTQACEAINHAHTKAIIHRDIKAGNVLAYLHDGKPTVKVIDFGIAKALTGDKLTEQTFNTERGQIIGTYETMSPEQAEGSADIDTRTDVYSLGVLLYELLAGMKPFDSETLRNAADHEMKRIIREVEPPRPSTRLSGLGAEATKIAAARREDLSALSKRLHSELEWIPLKALRKERDRRYVSPHQLAEDIQNYLDHKPLIAGPESVAYRARKFLRRNKSPLIAGSLVALTVILALTLVVGERIRAARAELRHAASVRTLMETLNMQIVEALPRFDPAQLPVVEQLLQHMLESARRELTEDDRAVVGLANGLARALTLEGKYLEAEELYRGVLAANRKMLPKEEAEYIASLNNLGALYLRWSRYPDAEPYLTEAVHRARLNLGDDDPLVLTSLNNMGTMLRRQKRTGEAEPLFREVLERRRRILPRDHPHLLGSIFLLADLLNQSGRAPDAEPLYRELYQLAPTAPIAATTAAEYMAGLGPCLVKLGKYSEAEQPLNEGYQRLIGTGQPRHAAMPGVLTALATMCDNTGRPQEASRWRAELAKLGDSPKPSTFPGDSGAPDPATRPD